MSDDTKQGNLKIIDEIEVKHRPGNFQDIRTNKAQVSYVHMIVDKVVKDLNKAFLSQLNNKLAEDTTSLKNLNDNVEGERKRIDKLMKEVGNDSEGLVKNLNDLDKKVKDIESKKSGDDDVDVTGEWQAEDCQNTDTELITM